MIGVYLMCMQTRKKIWSVISFLFPFGFAIILSGCAGATPSPEVINEMKAKGITKEQLCKATGRWMKLSNGSEECNMFYTPTMKDIEDGVRFAKFESTCQKMNGTMDFNWSGSSSNYNEKLHFCRVPRGEGLKREYIFGVSEVAFYSDVEKNELKKQAQEKAVAEKRKTDEARAKKVAEDRKTDEARAKKTAEDRKIAEVEAKKIAEAKVAADIEAAQAKMKELGVSEEEVRKVLQDSAGSLGALFGASYKDKVLTSKDIDNYVKAKEDAKKEAEYERNAKIKEGKQYICSDGYDSWTLKYNGGRITFGEINFQKDFFGTYIKYQGDKNYLIIDRAEGTVRYNGNVSKCKPR